MNKKHYEYFIQNYLSANRGEKLAQIHPSLVFIEKEHKFNGGRIDILAKKGKEIIGIELKAAPYNTQSVCAQILNYINYLSDINGKVYFIAPKIRYGVYSTLKNFYDSKTLLLFEFTKDNKDYFFKEVKPKELDDSRSFVFREENYPYTMFNNELKIKKGIDILIKNKKENKLIKSIIDSGTSDEKLLELIASSAADIILGKNKTIAKSAYELFKIL